MKVTGVNETITKNWMNVRYEWTLRDKDVNAKARPRVTVEEGGREGSSSHSNL